MAADIATPAILQYIDHNEYPESEDVAASELTTPTLQTLSQELHKQQETVKAEISKISSNASSDIDTWISRAKALQADILRSRETARQIVAEAESGKELRAKVEDRRKKVELLEKEVEFQKGVKARLEHVKHARGLIEDVRERIIQGELQSAYAGLEEAEESVKGLGDDSGVGSLLSKRAEKLRDQLKESVTAAWHDPLSVDVEERTVPLNGGVEELVGTSKSLEVFDGLLAKYARDVDRAVIRPRMMVGGSGKVPIIEVDAKLISCKDSSDDTSTASLFRDLTKVVECMHQHLPSTVAEPLADILMPLISTRLEEDWLEPEVPLDVTDMPAFQDLLNDTLAFADKIDQLSWSGSKTLRDWVRAAPRTWLTKRREAVLGDVRNLVFTGLQERKTVERVETQMVSSDDALNQGNEGGDDDWDTAWDEPEESVAAKTDPYSKSETDMAESEDEDASAWDMPDDEAETRKEDADEDDNAWGWGDGDEPPQEELSHPPPPLVRQATALRDDHPAPPQQQHQQPQEREMTLRETFTVTAIPDGILDLLHHIVQDAQTLAGPEYSSSPIAPAAAALYTLPTLALAIYRATAPTAYAKSDTGNMLIYNDANRLSDQLRSWQSSQPSSSRLRLDNDIKALDQFSKQAYSAEMEAQRTILKDLLDGAQGFSNSTTEPFKTECESAVEQTTDRLRDVYKQWQPVLSSSALLQSIGSLLATVTGKMIREIDDLPDIGEKESQQLRLLCDKMSTVKDLFLQQAPDGTGEPRDMTFIYCPNWLKFQYLGELMESSLADIKYLWKEGELSLEFTAEEVEGLIEALFAESSLRRQAIAEIKRSGRR